MRGLCQSLAHLEKLQQKLKPSQPEASCRYFPVLHSFPNQIYSNPSTNREPRVRMLFSYPQKSMLTETFKTSTISQQMSSYDHSML